MSNYTHQLQRVLPPLISAVGTLAVGGGIYSLVDPQAFSETLGISVTSSISPSIPFASFVGARNLGSGLTLLTLLYTGQRKAVGISLMCGVTVALTDAWICSKYKAKDGKAAGHAAMGILVGLLGAGIYWTDQTAKL